MNTSSDIINYQSELYLSQEYIQNNTGIDNRYLRVAKSRANKGGKSWKHTDIMNRCYFAYNSLPPSAQNKLCPLVELIDYARETHEDHITLIESARMSTYRRFLPAFKNQELATSIAIIHEASNYIALHSISFSKSAFFESLAKEIELQQIKYLPKTWRNLRDKIREYSQGQTTVKVKNIGNKNSIRHGNNKLLESWLIGMIESPKNYSAAYIFRSIRRMSIQHGMNDHPSVRWISDYMNRPEVQYITNQRYGATSRFNHKHRAYVPTQSALFAGDCWEFDGTRVNIIDHEGEWIDKDGKKHKGQKFLYIVAVRDVMSGMILGWDYCYKENSDVIINALAMAVKTSGYLPYEIRYDRFPGHQKDEWKRIETYLRMFGTIMTVTYKAEGKAHIERSWSTLQNVFMTDSELYYGEGIKSTRRYAHRSEEYVAEMRKWAKDNSFSYDDAVSETDKILFRAMNTPYSEYSRKYRDIDQSPSQLHEQSDKPNTYPVADYDWCFLFGLVKQVSQANNMIRTDIDCVTHYYGIDDISVIELYTGVKLTSCFDYEDLSVVHLYNNEDKYLGTFSEITPAQQYGPNKDMRAVGKLKAIAEKVKADRITKRTAIKTITMDESDDFSEVSMMQGGRIHKENYEENESAYLLNQWQEEDENIIITAKNQY